MEEIEDENSLTCTSRDNARVLRPVLRGARGETPRCPLGTTKHFKGRHTHGQEGAFTRRRLLPFGYLIVSILRMGKRGLQREMDSFFRETENEDVQHPQDHQRRLQQVAPEPGAGSLYGAQ